MSLLHEQGSRLWVASGCHPQVSVTLVMESSSYNSGEERLWPDWSHFVLGPYHRASGHMGPEAFQAARLFCCYALPSWEGGGVGTLSPVRHAAATVQRQCSGSSPLTGELTASPSFIRNMTTDFVPITPGLALEFWCLRWLPLGTTWEVGSIEVSIFLCWAGISQGQGLLFAVFTAPSADSSAVPDTPWMTYHFPRDLVMTLQSQSLLSWLSSPSSPSAMSLFLFLWMRRLRSRDNWPANVTHTGRCRAETWTKSGSQESPISWLWCVCIDEEQKRVSE